MSGVGFQRLFFDDPGEAELAAIEGVVIIDREPPDEITGVGTGVVLVVGEFEDGPFTPRRVSGATDLRATFGGFGYTYAGVGAENPSARSREADGGQVEYWNGNGFLACANKRFPGLVVQRVDTSVGEVEFSRLAAILGNANVTWDLEPAQTLVFDTDGGGNDTATFTAAAALNLSGAGSYPWAPAGGETITIAVDVGTSLATTKVVTFANTDTTKALVWARINAAFGFTIASDGGAVDKTLLTGRVRGTDGNVQIVAVSGASVTTATGFPAGAAVPGTGVVGNIDAVELAEVESLVNGANGAAHVDRDADGKIRIYSETALTGTIKYSSTSTATAFAFSPADTLAEAATGVDGIIPAGTRVQNVGGTVWVTMQAVTVADDDPGPYAVKVRPGLDDGSLGSAAGGTVTTLAAPIALGAFSVTNPTGLSAALTESQIDAAYTAALDATLDVNGDAQLANFCVSARQSNSVRSAVKANELAATTGGCVGRKAIVSPPLGTTTRAIARGASEPGVQAYYDNVRAGLSYAYPGVATRFAPIQARGTAGGSGFTADGVVDVHFDTFVASCWSQLNPEENPGQETSFLGGVLSIEAGNADVQAMGIGDYELLKAAGIMAPRINRGSAFIQSGVQAVDASTHPTLASAKRRAFADFLNDTFHERMGKFVKKLVSPDRRAQLYGEWMGFLHDLVTRGRMDSFKLDGISGNTKAALAKGIYRLLWKVRTLSSFDTIVGDSTVGETVDTTAT